MKYLLIIFSFCVSYDIRASSADFLTSFKEFIGISNSPKSIVLPILHVIERYPTESEYDAAMNNRFLGLSYKEDCYASQGYPQDIMKAMLCLHMAAQYGEPTSCTLMANYHRNGRYGIVIDEIRARQYELNMQWWKEYPPKSKRVASIVTSIIDNPEPSGAISTDDRSLLDSALLIATTTADDRRPSGDSDITHALHIDEVSSGDEGSDEPASEATAMLSTLGLRHRRT